MERDIFGKPINHYFNVFLRDLKNYGLWLLPLFLFLYLGKTNFVSHSELWSIASGNLFGQTVWQAMVVYVRPLFYLVLKIPFLFPLDNVQHIIVARLLFSAIAFANLVLIYRLVRIFNFSSKTAYLYCGLLFTFHVFFYNFYRVRSDFLALTFFLILLTLFLNRTAKEPSTKTRSLWIPVGVLLMVLATPKSIYWVGWLLIFFVWQKSPKQNFWDLTKQIVLFLLLPASILVVGFQLIGLALGLESNIFSNVLSFFYHSFDNSFGVEKMSALVRSLKINGLHYLLVLIGIGIYFLKERRANKNRGYLVALSLFSILTLLVHPNRWDYFIASQVPFVALPLLFVFERIKLLTNRLSLVILLAWLPLYMTYYQGWHSSNEEQLRRIKHVELVIDHFRGWRVFDSTGILPRARNFLSFYGPDDIEGNMATTEQVMKNGPELIIFTPKLREGGPTLLIFLHQFYEEVAPGFWVHKDQVEYYKEIPFPPWNHHIGLYFGYDYLPKIRFSN